MLIHRVPSPRSACRGMGFLQPCEEMDRAVDRGTPWAGMDAFPYRLHPLPTTEKAG